MLLSRSFKINSNSNSHYKVSLLAGIYSFYISRYFLVFIYYERRNLEGLSCVSVTLSKEDLQPFPISLLFCTLGDEDKVRTKCANGNDTYNQNSTYEYCQALVPNPVPLEPIPIPNPKKLKIQSPIGTGVTLKSHGPPPHPTPPPTYNF